MRANKQQDSIYFVIYSASNLFLQLTKVLIGYIIIAWAQVNITALLYLHFTLCIVDLETGPHPEAIWKY